ncbi:MAG: glycosyltransferase family 39 protein [Chloroflexota bacterium]
MALAKKRLSRLIRWEYTGLILILVATLALHLSVITRPRELILDEQHYVPDARAIIQEHKTLREEHPPLGKLFISLGILVFGDNPRGWRMPSVLMGTAGIVLFYLICRELRMSQRACLIATFLMAFENLTFVQASVAMLDVFYVTFMFACFLCYLKGKYPLAAVLLTLSALAKLPGAFAGLAIGLHWIMTNRTKALSFFASMLLSLVSFFALLPVFSFIINRRFISPFQQVNTMLSLSSSLTFASAQHESMTRPWEWVILPKIMPYWYKPNYMAAISFTLWGLIIPAVAYLIFRAVRKNSAGSFGLVWFTGTYLIWIPLSLLTNRISFVFYFYPTIGAVCLGVGLGLSRIVSKWGTRDRKRLRWVILPLFWGFLIAHLVVFVILSPVFT